MPRVSIKPHHKQYLNLIAQQMGCDQVAAIDYLLWELRRQGYAFGSPLPSAPAPVVQAVQPPQPVGVFTPFQEVTPVPATTPVFEEDEVISRFISLGMEEF